MTVKTVPDAVVAALVAADAARRQWDAALHWRLPSLAWLLCVLNFAGLSTFCHQTGPTGMLLRSMLRMCALACFYSSMAEFCS